MTTPPLDLPALRRDITSAARCEPGDAVHPWEEVDPDHLIDLLDRAEATEKKLAAVWAMVEEMGEAVAFDALTTPHGEAEYPVSYLREQLEKALDGGA